MKELFTFLLLGVICLSGFSAERQEAVSKRDARFEKTWPDSDDLKWFQKAKGMTENEVLKEYGPPSAKTRTRDGRIRWSYPWLAAAHMNFKDGKVDFVFYTAGY